MSKITLLAMLFSPPDTGLLSHIPALFSVSDLLNLKDINPTTFQAYRYNLTYCDQWLTGKGYSRQLPLNPHTIREWFTELVELEHKTSNTITQRRSALTWLHDINGYQEGQNPCHDACLLRIGFKTQRTRKHKNLGNKVRQKAPLRLSDIKRLVRHCPDSKIGKRDKALLLLGFAGAFRRGELSRLLVGNVTSNPDKSLTITVSDSKTDKLATGQSVVIHPSKNPNYCPIVALSEWLKSADIQSGYLFPGFTNSRQHLTPQSIANIVKKYCRKAGLNPDLFAGHSLRRGLLITAAEKGADINDLRVHARHTRSTMTENYIGQAAFKNRNPTKVIW